MVTEAFPQMTTETAATYPPLQRSAWRNGSFLEVAPDLACFQLSIVNVYFFGQPGAMDRSWVLIDAGMPFSRRRITRAAEERFGRGSRPAAIVLTHGHFDHVGALPELADEWGVPIFAHELEMPYLTGKSSYPPPDPTVGGGAMALLSPLYPRGPFNFASRVRVLPTDGSVPGMPGWRWIHTPGHSPGHVSFFRDADRTLVAGDAFVTVKQESALAVLFQPKAVHPPPAYYTPDWESARRSIETLTGLHPNVAATGHGLPMYGERLQQELEALLRNWGRIGVPSHGRYVHQPAVADEHGVVSVPPPVIDPKTIALGAAGLAALAGLAFFASRKGSRT